MDDVLHQSAAWGVDPGWILDARDPTTDPARLRTLAHDLIAHRAGESGREPDHSRDPLLAIVVRNPSLPLNVLRWVLLHEHPKPYTCEAWYNPSVPLLLMREPLPDFDRAASRAIRHLMLDGEAPPEKWADPGPLAHRVATLARKAWLMEPWRPRDPFEAFGPHARAARALARHMAGLFSLPWPTR